jgi:small GTP-binding protein
MYDDSLKIIVFGDNFPEKTALTQKFLTNLFVSDSKMTIGIDFEVKSLTVDGQKVKLQIWEFGGEERFRFLLSTYVRGADGGLFVYDIANYSSIAHIDDWLSAIRKEIRAEDMGPILAVGIVPDEKCERQVSAEEGIKIAKVDISYAILKQERMLKRLSKL